MFWTSCSFWVVFPKSSVYSKLQQPPAKWPRQEQMQLAHRLNFCKGLSGLSFSPFLKLIGAKSSYLCNILTRKRFSSSEEILAERCTNLLPLPGLWHHGIDDWPSQGWSRHNISWHPPSLPDWCWGYSCPFADCPLLPFVPGSLVGHCLAFCCCRLQGSSRNGTGTKPHCCPKNPMNLGRWRNMGWPHRILLGLGWSWAGWSSRLQRQGCQRELEKSWGGKVKKKERGFNWS